MSQLVGFKIKSSCVHSFNFFKNITIKILNKNICVCLKNGEN